MPRPEINPIISLIPVPEFPNLDFEALIKGNSLLHKITYFRLLFIEAPISLRALRVEFGSFASRKPLISISQFNNEPILVFFEI